MKLGAAFPQNEIGTDPIAIRDYAQAAESLGYEYIVALEHVLGPDPENRPVWSQYLNVTDCIHEPFVLFAHLGAVTSKIGFMTSILVLPQRQTALVAKQAAEVDVLTGGRLTLGVGVGYNQPEYEAVGADFTTRGRRMEEQIHVLRQLWTQPVVEFHGKWHNIDRAGINPLPIQRPIPILMGGSNERVIDRVCRLADGWIPSTASRRLALPGFFQPEDIDDLPRRFAQIKEGVRAAGRDPAKFQIRGQVATTKRTPDEWIANLQQFRDLGFDYVSVETRSNGLDARGHIELLRRYKEEVAAVDLS